MGNLKKNKQTIITKIQNLDTKTNTLTYTCLSCIYGAFLGDAMETYCEFNKSDKDNYEKIFIGKPKFGDALGQVTDDSEMAMSLAYGIMDKPLKNELDSNYLYYYYGCWYKTNLRNIVYTAKTAIKSFDYNNNLPKLKNFNKEVKPIIRENNSNFLSNEFLKRISPFTCLFFTINLKLIKDTFFSKSKNNQIKNLVQIYFSLTNEIAKDNIYTHPKPETTSAAAFFTLFTIGAILTNFGFKKMNTIKKITKMFNSQEFHNNINITMNDLFLGVVINNYLKLFRQNDFDAWNFFTWEEAVTKQFDFYMHAFKLTLYYFLNFDKYLERYGKNTYQEIIHEICNYRGDTETNAVIVGTVIGPLLGYKNFGKEFDIMLGLMSKGREIYIPVWMFFYEEFLIKTNQIPREKYQIYS